MDLERVILSQVRENSIQYRLYMEPKKKQYLRKRNRVTNTENKLRVFRGKG